MTDVVNESELLDNAIQLALDNVAAGEGPFAALAVRDHQVLATAVNTVMRDNDPTAHAETAVVRQTCRMLDTLDLSGITVVSSCEPCPLCLVVLQYAGVAGVVFAATKEDAADSGFALPPVAERAQASMRAELGVWARQVDRPRAREPFARFARIADDGQLRATNRHPT